MPTLNKRATSGAILVAIGLLCEVVAISEQPDRVQFSPNRFYTAADLHELEAAHQTFHELQTGKAFMKTGDPSDEEQRTPDSEKDDDSVAAERAAMLTSAESTFMTLQRRQDTAFRNQEIVSQTLKWGGIGLLAGAVLLLSRTGRARPATVSNAMPDRIPD